MDVLWQELSLGIASREQFLRVLIRLTAAAVLAGLIGYTRERQHRPAGLRTHILVALGTAVFVIACTGAGFDNDGLSRVIQGIATGIGFIGAGSIIKLRDRADIKGLTTAAGIWMTCAIGVLTGLGEVGLAIVATVFAFLVFTAVRGVERRLGFKPEDSPEIEPPPRNGE